MSLPVPKPGLVIRYSFLWSTERWEGATEGSKDRPCAIVVAAPRDPAGDIRTVVAPITHRPPEDPTASIEIPPHICRALGLDAGRHWLRLDELNSFAWPGYDLRPVPGQMGRYHYGMLPPGLFQQVRGGILARCSGCWERRNDDGTEKVSGVRFRLVSPEFSHRNSHQAKLSAAMMILLGKPVL